MAKKPTLKDLEQQVLELTDALQRERADAANIRRRNEEQIASLKTLVTANVVRDLLPAFDNLERALGHAPKELQNNDYIKGVESVKKQFEKVLQELGVERVKTIGELFDPSLHEAVGMEDGEGSTEVVSEELTAGYRLSDEVIRHAMVKVRLEDR